MQGVTRVHLLVLTQMGTQLSLLDQVEKHLSQKHYSIGTGSLRRLAKTRLTGPATHRRVGVPNNRSLPLPPLKAFSAIATTDRIVAITADDHVVAAQP